MALLIPEQQSSLCDSIARTLENNGWCITPDFLSSDLVSELAAEIEHRRTIGGMRAARVGTGSTLRSDNTLRGDEIAWIDTDESSPALRALLLRMESLRNAINEHLFLGLFDLEFHLTHYPPGARYGRHIDRHSGTTDRIVSCIIYLNADWQPADGGALRLYPPQHPAPGHVDVVPIAGTLVTFMSGDIPHEVLTTRRSRLSATGWFRHRPETPRL